MFCCIGRRTDDAAEVVDADDAGDRLSPLHGADSPSAEMPFEELEELVLSRLQQMAEKQRLFRRQAV